MATVILGSLILVGWAALELILREPGTASGWDRSAEDRSSTVVLLTGYAVAVALQVFVRDPDEPAWLAWLGVTLGLLGLALRAWAMRTLGAAYTRTLRTVQEQGLVTVGPYRWVRNPGYAASLLIWLGASLAFHSWPAAALVTIVLGLAYGWRIRNEERMLAVRFGDAWRSYAARTARVIPRLL